MSAGDRSAAGHGHEHGHDHGHEHGHDHGQGHGHGHEPGGERGLVGWVLRLVKPHRHDAAESVDAALEGSAEGIRAVKVSLAGLGLTAVAQALLVALTGSVALFADTVHNFSDALTAVPLWAAFVLARRPVTRRYTYGYGRAEDLAGIFIVGMIALSAAVAGYESVRRLIDPHPPEHLTALIGAGLVGFAGNEVVAAYRIRIGRRIGSAALVADGLHARADGFTSLAVVLGALGVLAGFPLADPLVGLGITLAILVVLKSAWTEVYRRLMDGIDPELLSVAETALHATPGVTAIEDLRLRWTGHRIRAETSVVVDPALTLADAHAIAHEAQHRLAHSLPKLHSATVHVSPAEG